MVLVSHGLLDTLTDGGLGCALLWPFDLTRYFAPWRPIPVAPIGLDFLSLSGLVVSLTELVLFLPLILFALRLDRLNRYVLPVWCVSAWLMTSADPVREAAVGFVLREDTEYASGFSDRSFHTIRDGDSESVVRRVMGAPLGEWWVYRTGPDGCPVVYFQSDTATAERHVQACSRLGIRPGHVARGRASCARRAGRSVLDVHPESRARTLSREGGVLFGRQGCRDFPAVAVNP